MTSRRRRKPRNAARAASPATPPPARAPPDGVVVRAVKTTRGRAATTVQVEIEPGRVAGAAEEVQAVVAELPRVDRDGRAVRWEEQPLSPADDDTAAGRSRMLRYVATRYGGSDAPRYGIRVRVRTRAGTVARDGVRVREADKPEDE